MRVYLMAALLLGLILVCAEAGDPRIPIAITDWRAVPDAWCGAATVDPTAQRLADLERLVKDQERRIDELTARVGETDRSGIDFRPALEWVRIAPQPSTVGPWAVAASLASTPTQVVKAAVFLTRPRR